MLTLTEVEKAIEKLTTVHEEMLSLGQLKQESAESAGYAAVHVARRATEDAFRDLHKKRDLAPGLKLHEEAYGLTLEEARHYLQESMMLRPSKGSALEQTLISVMNLMDALRRENNFVLAVRAKEVAILLLGRNSLGGIYAEWQTSTLGVGLLSWKEQYGLNKKILSRVKSINQDKAKVDAVRYGLFPSSWIMVGCHINIARFSFRAIANNEAGDIPEIVLEAGSKALRTIEGYIAIDPKQYEKYEIAVLEAMETALLEFLALENPRNFWTHVTHQQASEVINIIIDSEPYECLIDIVLSSARKSGINCSNLRVHEKAMA